jgi:phosphatidylglycerophosphatase A
MSADSGTAVPNATEASGIPVAAQRKPRLTLFIATACGLGYIPIAPGTFGSLAGLALALLPWWSFLTISAAIIAAQNGDGGFFVTSSAHHPDPFLWAQIALAMLTAGFGVWSASRAALYWQQGDPQRVVIDEVSGQHLTLLLGCSIPVWWKPFQFPPEGEMLGLISIRSALNWKYLLLGFILFRVFDIWKPFPARQAESLPGGWGIMADDWVAGIYAGIGLWLARAAGL